MGHEEFCHECFGLLPKIKCISLGHENRVIKLLFSTVKQQAANAKNRFITSDFVPVF